MATEVRWRRGTAAQHAAFTGALSEITHDTTMNALRVHDGSTPGGFRTIMAHNVGMPGGVAPLDDEGFVPDDNLRSVQKATLYSTSTALQEDVSPATSDYIKIQGYITVGDGGRALYKKVLTEPSHAGKLQKGDGTWWEIAEQSYKITMFGARQGNVNTYAAANTAAIQGAIDTAAALGVREVLVPTGVFVIATKITIGVAVNVRLKGYGRGSQLKGGNSYSGEIILYGGPVASGGIQGDIIDLTIGEVLSGTCNGIQATNANTGQLHGIYFRGCGTCITLTDSFSVKISRCDFSVPANYAIRSSTSCHNLEVNACWFWTSGAAAIRIEGPTAQIKITGNDFEFCQSVIQTSATGELRAVDFSDNYVEGCVNREFSFGTACYGFECNSNRICLRGSVPGSGVGSGAVSTYDNIIGGSFKYNEQMEQNIAFAGTCAGITVVPGRLTSNSSLGTVPYKDPGTLSNNWTKTDTTNYPVGYSRDGEGYLHIKGQITSGTGSPGTAAFTLPVGYRPATRLVIPCMTTTGITQVIIDVNGNVAPSAAVGVSVWLDAIRIPVTGSLT